MWNKRKNNEERLFGWKDEKARGRTCMVASAFLASVISWLSGGMFYTSFLMTNGINIVNVGIITFIPFIANCFAVFSPSILERFAKRRWILGASRAAYYLLLLLGITVMPKIVAGESARLVCFVVLTFAANIINALFTSGYQVWHVNFIPDSIRPRYFTAQIMITAFVGQTSALVSSIAADAFAGSPYQSTIIIAFRFIALALGILDVTLLSTPREYPYPKSEEHPRFRDIFIKPLSCKPFALTMLIVFLWNLAINLPSGSLNYYLIESVGTSYTFVYALNMLYPIIFAVEIKLARKILSRHGWFVPFALAIIGVGPMNILYGFTTAGNYLWVMTIVRVVQHIFGVVHNSAYASLPYANLPDTDQTNYMSFHVLAVNIGGFLGTMLGTLFISMTQSWTMQFLGYPFKGTQALLMVEGVLEILLGLLVIRLRKDVEPTRKAV